MAAIDTPWMTSMSTTDPNKDGVSSQSTGDAPTVAAFSPSSTIHSPAFTRQRATILVHQKSPLLIATPPQITRALAYSHPFLLPLNKLVGLLSWTTGEPWESFLLMAAFWAIVLYGDVVLRWGGPLVFVLFLILGMYSRRYSPLSSTGWISEQSASGHTRKESDGKVRHHKSLDEIVETLKLFTSRCNILLDPFLRLTDFLSTQSTATSATTRPALTTLFLRILIVTPVWYLLTLPPLKLITSKRIVLIAGTLILSWHSKPALVSRTILWRSRLIRQICSTITGLQFGSVDNTGSSLSDPASSKVRPTGSSSIAAAIAAARASKSSQSIRSGNKSYEANVKPEGIRFTFTLYENQRRWLGIGWTYNMFAYERAAWTDEQGNPAPPKDEFKLPEVEGGIAKWQWCEGSRWEVEGEEEENDQDQNDTTTREKSTIETISKTTQSSRVTPKDGGWIYYDNKWRDGRRQDGWGRYTRRRKWCRDAELIEVTTSSETAPLPTVVTEDTSQNLGNGITYSNETQIGGGQSPYIEPRKQSDGDTASIASGISIGTSRSTTHKRGISSTGGGSWWRRARSESKASTVDSGMDVETASFSLAVDRDDDEYTDDYGQHRTTRDTSGWGIGDDIEMELG